jgi:hypothetical protein
VGQLDVHLREAPVAHRDERGVVTIEHLEALTEVPE